MTAIRQERVYPAVEGNSQRITIPRIDVPQTRPNRLLVVLFAARGRSGKNQIPVVTYDEEPMDFQSIGKGEADSQFGGTWIYTLMEPSSGGAVEIVFDDFVPEDLAACAVVFSGVDPDHPIGSRDGALFTKLEQSVSPYGVAVEPWQDGSLLLCAIVSGRGDENSLAAVSANVDVVKTIPAGKMSLNVTSTVVAGADRQALGVILGPESSRNLFAMIEIVSAPPEALSITEVSFEGIRHVVPPGTTLENGVAIPGRFGVLTIGADGSYNYEASESLTDGLDPSVYLEEVFGYVLSDGTQSSIGVPVFDYDDDADLPEAATLEIIPEDDAVSEVVAAVTSISHARGGRVEVPGGTSSINGVSIEGDHGVLTMGADGTYTYEVHPNTSLAPSDPVKEVFNYVVFDGSASSPATLEVEVEGVESDYSPEAGAGAEAAGNLPRIVKIGAHGQELQDVAEGSTLTNGPTVVAGAYGLLTIGADGGYDYAVNRKLVEGGVVPEDVFTYVLSNNDSATITITAEEEVRLLEPTPMPTEEKVSPMVMEEQEVAGQSAVSSLNDQPSTLNYQPLPLGQITRLFDGPEDWRFFCGFKIMSCEQNERGEVFIGYVPYFAGAALTPSASIRVSIHDNFGIEHFDSFSVSADSSGSWTAESGIDLDDEVTYSITIDEFPAAWEISLVPVRSMMAKFSGSFNPEDHLLGSLAVGQIIGDILNAQSMEQIIRELQP